MSKILDAMLQALPPHKRNRRALERACDLLEREHANDRHVTIAVARIRDAMASDERKVRSALGLTGPREVNTMQHLEIAVQVAERIPADSRPGDCGQAVSEVAQLRAKDPRAIQEHYYTHRDTAEVLVSLARVPDPTAALFNALGQPKTPDSEAQRARKPS